MTLTERPYRCAACGVVVVADKLPRGWHVGTRYDHVNRRHLGFTLGCATCGEPSQVQARPATPATQRPSTRPRRRSK